MHKQLLGRFPLFALPLLVLAPAIWWGAADEVTYHVNTYVITSGGEAIPATRASYGDIVHYELQVMHTGPTTMPAESVKVTGPVPQGTYYVPESAIREPHVVTEFTQDLDVWAEDEPEDVMAIRWTLLDPFEPGQTVTLHYQVSVGVPVTGPVEFTPTGVVTYRVRVPPGCTGSITMAGREGTTQQFSNVRDGWEYSFMGSPGQFLYLSVQNQCEHGSVSAIIMADGRIVNQASSTGAYVIASASGTLD